MSLLDQAKANLRKAEEILKQDSKLPMTVDISKSCTLFKRLTMEVMKLLNEKAFVEELPSIDRFNHTRNDLLLYFIKQAFIGDAVNLKELMRDGILDLLFTQYYQIIGAGGLESSHEVEMALESSSEFIRDELYEQLIEELAICKVVHPGYDISSTLTGESMRMVDVIWYLKPNYKLSHNANKAIVYLQ